MNSTYNCPEKHRISPSHRNLLKFVWKVHQGIRNDLEDQKLRSLVVSYWQHELKEHLLNEEIEISLEIKNDNAVTEKFFQYHKTFKKKISEIIEANTQDIKDSLEQLCILLIEMVRFEERQLRSFRKNNSFLY